MTVRKCFLCRLKQRLREPKIVAMPSRLQHTGKFLIGVISDTHGLMRPEAINLLQGSDLIVHAGDVGKPGVLENLQSIAPVIAVRGNIDRDEWTAALPEREVVEIGAARLYVLHDLKELDCDPAVAGFGAIISGHSHKPLIENRDGVLFLNPGSAGPRRFRLPVTAALLYVSDGRLDAHIIEVV